MKKEQIIVRHGDVVIYKISDETESATEGKSTIDSLILAEGEASGHIHKVSPCDKGVLEVVGKHDTKNVNVTALDEVSFIVKGKASITHQDHEPIILGEGTYLRRIQRVYDPFTKQINRDAD